MVGKTGELLMQVLPRAGAWHVENLAGLVDVCVLCQRVGLPRTLESTSYSPTARAVSCFIGHQMDAGAKEAGFRCLQGLDAEARDALLEQAEAFVSPRFASELAVELERGRLWPVGGRLAALLAIGDPAACQRLLLRLGEASGSGSAAWIRAAIEAVLSVADRRLPLPGWLEEIAHRLETVDPLSMAGAAESYAAQLRLAARHDLEQGLAMLRRAVLDVGYYEVEDGMLAVLGRLAAEDTRRVMDYVDDETTSMEHKALATRCAAFLPGEVDVVGRHLGHIVDEFAADVQSGVVPARPAWSSAFELLAAAASLGDAGVAALIVQAVGPPLWTVFSATWRPMRRRAFAGWRDATDFWEQVVRAWQMAPPGIAASGAPPAPPWERFSPTIVGALWQLKTLPEETLPWWTPWDGGLP